MVIVQQFVDGKWVDGETANVLRDKFSDAEIATVHEASREQVGRATRAVQAAQESTDFVPYRRFEVLARAAELVAERAQEFTAAIMADTGFIRADAAKEVERCQQTLLLSGEEARRLVGSMVPVDAAPGGSRRLAFTLRKPLGVVCAITPFNSPLNTVAHKVAPALAAGNGVVLKPSAYTPLTARLLVQVLLDAGLPEGLIALVNGGGSTVGQWLLEDEVPQFYAFTGSTAVGDHIRRTIGIRRGQLELGSLSSTIVCDDADLERAVPLCLNAAFRKAGQVCTSVQRLYVHESVVDDFQTAALAYLADRPGGDPAAPGTFVGPVISHGDADRIESWVQRAEKEGAAVVTGGTRDRQVLQPTVLRDVSLDMEVMSREIFGPVVSLRPFEDFDAAVREVNETPFGLAAGIFTARIDRALTAARELRMGSIHINEPSSARLDLMPFGGVKASGSGKEGPRYAIEEMTDECLVTIG